MLSTNRPDGGRRIIEELMAVIGLAGVTNWFEAGRRISRQLMAVVALAGAALVVFVTDPMPTVSTRAPTMPWFVSDRDCGRSSYRVRGWNDNWGAGEAGLALCFLAFDNGQIPYAVAPTVDEEKLRQARQEAEDRVRMGRAEPRVVRLNSEWFYAADANDSRVYHYADRRVQEFMVTPELRKRLHATRLATRWRAHEKMFRDVAPWVLGICAVIWIFTILMGLNVRLFAGVPTFQDVRDDEQQ